MSQLASSQAKRKMAFNNFRHIVIDALIIAAALYLSLALRLSGDDKGQHFQTLKNLILIFVTVRVLTLYFFKVYRSIWRYSSMVDMTRLLKAVAFSGMLFVVISYMLPEKLGRLPRSIYFIDFFIAMAGLGGIRILTRLYFERQTRKLTNRAAAQRVLIYGAGENGRHLANRIKNDPHILQNPIGFIDDDPTKIGKTILGVPVLGSGDDFENIILTKNIDGVIVSISNPSGELVRDIIKKTRRHNITPQIYNSFSEKTAGAAQVYRNVSLYDLLNRQSAEIDYSAIKSLVSNKVVLVTGAGGSIGSEISRQLHKYGADKLLLLDHSEFNLYNIDAELRLSANDKNKIIPILLDIKDKNLLENVFAQYKPEVVFHAAAYKHVHLVEYNPFSDILNNILGTHNLLDLCSSYGVSTFLNISTDKAVNPVGIMGATKRVCELLTSQAGIKLNKKYCSVRFGNVLGSSGSLIPLLQKQIQDGGPLTITHPEMKRYFMLIPEAVSLCLMSTIISQPGDINVLKMGDQIKILDIARSLITLSGKTESEIEIIFTGLRPGEKMYEEMYICGDEIKTAHPDILTIPRGDNSHFASDFISQVMKLIELAKMHDTRAQETLAQLASIGRRDLNT